jgi:hypothetical protein
MPFNIYTTNEGALFIEIAFFTINCCGCQSEYFSFGWFELWVGMKLLIDIYPDWDANECTEGCCPWN